jgi:hypothetical protein
MLAVSNTSPISNLAIIGHLDLLKLQFGELWIPEAVARELSVHPDPVAIAAIQRAISDSWIKVASPTNPTLLKILLSSLDQGEAEAIALATERGADIVIIDEQEGRRIATLAGLRVTGALGVLLRAKRIGQVPAVKPELRALRAKARFFIAASLEAQILSAADE